MLIDSGAAISLIRHSTYNQIDYCYKTPIQSTAAKLNTADGSPMTILGSTALHLRIADFTFGTRTTSAIYKGMANSYLSRMPHAKRPQLEL